MGLVKLNKEEIRVIEASIELRRKKINNNPSRRVELHDILERVNRTIIDLKPLQRAKLSGCIREYMIYPNEDLFKLSDYQVFCSIDEIKDRMRKVDIGLNAINALKDKKDKKLKIFENTIEKVNQLASKSRVYFSETNFGKVYKLGIVGEDGVGIIIEAHGALVENFVFRKVSEDLFMKSSSPKDLIEKIRSYGQENELTKNQTRALVILEKANV